MCPWNPNIPLATDEISDSQNDLLNDLQSIDAWVNVNHVGFDSAPNTGKHKLVEMPQQAGPAFAPIAGEVALECLASAYGANAPTLVYLQNALPPIEMTSAGLTPSGWSFLPSGLLLKWGSFAIAGLGQLGINLNSAGFPVYGTGIFSAYIQVTGSNANLDPNIAIIINSQMTTPALLAYNVVTRSTALAPTFPCLGFYMTLGI